MPLAQIAEPWPTMELVQLETEVCSLHLGLGSGCRGLGSLDVVGLSWLTRLCNITWRSGTVPLD
uniref:Uncharacterized protein n=1 Tax=Periophthalmus magnuspinnatus TaxID=409849 RepID=A0A3B4AFM9_9GOBI